MVSLPMGVYPENAPWGEYHLTLMTNTKEFNMNKTIATLVVVFFFFSFYSFMFSSSKGAAENIKEEAAITSVDAACKQQKELCEEL